MTKIKNPGIYVTMLILAGASYYFVGAAPLSASSDFDTTYQGIEFDSLSANDLDIISAVKTSMSQNTTATSSTN